ncbi:MAG: FHA domain-containing protein, partial [Chrysiogenales bacterium]
PLDDSEFVYSRAVLIQKNGIQRGEKYHVQGKETLIGGSSENAIVINDGAVSPRHAKIALIRNVYYIFDLISDGGTFLNGKKLLRPKALHDWDEIRIGRTLLLFRGFTDRV